MPGTAQTWKASASPSSELPYSVRGGKARRLGTAGWMIFEGSRCRGGLVSRAGHGAGLEPRRCQESAGLESLKDAGPWATGQKFWAWGFR